MKSKRFKKSGLFVVLAGAAAITLPLLGTSAATASTPSPNTPTPVSDGVSASTLPNATVFGNTPADTPESVSFILRIKDASALESAVTHGVRNYESVGQFAKSYGADPSTIAALRSYLAGFGITTAVLSDNVDVTASGTAGEFDSALSVTQQQYHVPRVKGQGGHAAIPAQTVHANLHAPKLPYSIAGSVLAVLGLTNYSPFSSDATHIPSSLVHPKALSGSDCAVLTGFHSDCNLPSDFASDYGLTKLGKSADGAGQTIGIVTLAAMDIGAPEYFWSNVADVPSTGRTVQVQNIDGGPGAPSYDSGSGETDLDVEQSGGVAPGANIIVYQAPNTDAGFADAFYTAASQNTASSVSASWGESETILAASVAAGEETPAYEAVFDQAFLEFAAQGQSGFLSAADSGAYDASGDLGTTNLSVDASGDSPYITSAGGTTRPISETIASADGSITAPVVVTKERAWGWDYLFAPVAKVAGITETAAAEELVTGGGGGFSKLEPTPSYQQGVPGTHTYSAVPYLTPTSYDRANGILLPEQWNFNGTPPTIHGVATGRAEPDVSANADPESGYLEYSPSFLDSDGPGPALEGGWGGTSFVAPQLNGAAAVIDSSVGHRVGFWNPAMYAAATSNNSPLTPLNTSGTSNDNLYYSGQPGTVYNPSTGLGTPNLSALAGFLAR
jgi:kumamolisin